MFFSKSLVTLGLASMPLAFATIHDIQVGADGLKFTPEAISAEVGDQVVFHFVSKNHTATQSSFASPCGPKDGGFNSGFMPVPANQTDNLPIHTISVYDTTPMWVFCAQSTPVNHCGQGMVFAINCGADGSPNSFTSFKQAALDFGASLAPPPAAPSSTPDAGSGGYGSSGSGGYGSSGSGGYGSSDSGSSSSSSSSSSDSSAPPPASTDSASTPPPPPADSSNSASSSSSDASKSITVVVGDATGDLTFTPSNITAAPGTVINFEFHQKNHSVVQSTFAAPCAPMTGGFKSDFFAVDPTATDFKSWSITVNDSTPIWAYCRQTAPKSHCGAGMVFSVNAVETGDKSFSSFQRSAEAANGTATNTTGATAGNGAASSHLGGMGMVVAAITVIASLL